MLVIVRHISFPGRMPAACLSRRIAMGYDKQPQSSSSGVTAATLVAVLLFAIMGVVVVALGGLFFVRASRMQSNVGPGHGGQLSWTEAQTNTDAGAVTLEAMPMLAVHEPITAVSVIVQLDQLGKVSIDGELVDLDTLKAQLAALKQESNGRLSVELDVDPGCRFEHVVSVIDVCNGIGAIKYQIRSLDDSESSTASTVADE
jgi:biopolymer transport protein ExbD